MVADKCLSMSSLSEDRIASDRSIHALGRPRAEDFVNFLLTEGGQLVCDETNKSFYQCEEVPKFFNKDKFERAQAFYKKNICGMYLTMYLSVVYGMAIPWVRDILMVTRKSSTPTTARKRYVETAIHVHLWYTEEFSSLFRSFATVRRLHNNASNKASQNSLSRITQRDMALTQIGFFGFAIIHPKYIGIHDATNEDFEALIHFWRVIGYLLGIENRFNVCNGTLEETRQIALVVLDHILLPNVDERHEDFINMTTVYISGMKLLPFPGDLNILLEFLNRLLADMKHQKAVADVERLTLLHKLQLIVYIYLGKLCKFYFIRSIMNYLIRTALAMQIHIIRRDKTTTFN